MNKLKNVFFALGLIISVFIGSTAFAEGIGFIDMEKVQSGYPAVQAAVKEISQRELSLQEYLLQKEKESKSLDTPIQKKNFEEKIAKEFRTKKEDYLKFKQQKEEEIYNKIKNAARTVLVEQSLDAVVDARFIFVGGIDISDLVLAKLKGTK